MKEMTPEQARARFAEFFAKAQRDELIKEVNPDEFLVGHLCDDDGNPVEVE